MKMLYKDFEDKETLNSYLPMYKNLNKIDKTYFLNIINTLKPNYIDDVVFDCIRKRQIKKRGQREDYV